MIILSDDKESCVLLDNSNYCHSVSHIFDMGECKLQVSVN